MNKAPPPNFNGFQPAQVDFDAARTGMLAPYKKIDIDLSVAPTNATNWYDVEGDFIYQDLDPTLSGGNVSIEFNKRQDADNAPIYLVPGIGHVGVFKGIKLNWAVQAGKKARLVYSTGSRIVPGSPNVTINGSVSLSPGDARWYNFGDYESQQLQAFFGGGQPGPVAAQVPFVQLFNPGASGKIAYVDLIEFAPLTGADRFQLYTHNAAIGALVYQGINKSVGGAAGVVAVRSGTTAAVAGTLTTQGAALANTTYAHVPKAPYVLNPGFGLTVYGFTVNTTDLVNFDWREKAT